MPEILRLKSKSGKTGHIKANIDILSQLPFSTVQHHAGPISCHAL